MSNRGEHPSVYYEGRDCRRAGGSKLANPFASHTFHGSWFLAGWNDMDLEIEQKNPAIRNTVCKSQSIDIIKIRIIVWRDEHADR